MSTFKSLGLALGCGVVALMIGHVVSYYLLPIPHLVIGPLLAATAFFLCRRESSHWLLLSLGVVIPFAVMALFTIGPLHKAAEDLQASLSYGDYAAMLSPIALGFAGGLLARLLARR